MKNIPLLIFILGCLFPSLVIAQNQDPIKFSYQYLRKGDSNDIKLIVQNNSSKRTFYYSVSLASLVDTGWVTLLSDIDALGQKEFLALLPIKAGQKVIKKVSKKRIISLYQTYPIKKVRFGVMYYEKPTLESKGEIIYLPPF